MSHPRGFKDRANDGLLSLIGEVPELVRNLVVAEVNSAKVWISKTAKDAGIGVVWFLAALFFLFWAVPVFGTFLIAGISSWWPVWLSALVVFVIMLVIVAVLALFGVLRMRKLAARENPAQAIKHDAGIVKDVTDEL